MADYYTHLSVALALPDPAAQTYALELAGQAKDAWQGDKLPARFPAKLRTAAEDWTFQTEPDGTPEAPGLWFHSDAGGVDALCVFIQHLLRKFSPSDRVTFEWSHDCSKSRLDAYGGGAAVVTAKSIKTFSTSRWLAKHTT